MKFTEVAITPPVTEVSHLRPVHSSQSLHFCSGMVAKLVVPEATPLRLTSLTVEDIFGSTEQDSIFRILLISILNSHLGLGQMGKIVKQVI